MYVTSESATAASRSVVACSRPSASANNPCRPGSYTGARPARMSSTLSPSASTPRTANPRAARQAAIGVPSFPSPTTQRRSGVPSAGCGRSMPCLRYRRHAEMPTQVRLQPAKERPRHRLEVPRALVFVPDVLRDPVREDVLDEELADPEAVPGDQVTHLTTRVGQCHRRTLLRLRVARGQVAHLPDLPPAVPEDDLQDLPREAVIDHQLQDRPRAAVPAG